MIKQTFYKLYLAFNYFCLNKKLKSIKLVVTDVDGVLTDGGISLDESGQVFRKFNVKDGLGIKLLQETGIKVVFLSGGTGKSIHQRAKQLNVEYCFTEIKDKIEPLKKLQEDLNINKENTLYIGDDLNDIPIKAHVSLLISPSDAVKPFKLVSDFLLSTKGGEGAFRELADLLLKSKNNYKFFYKGFYKKN